MALREPAVARRAAGRPTQKVLSKEWITQAALRLIGADGYESFTISNLAKKLNVAPSALYNHISSKQDVLRWLEDHVMGMVDVSGFGVDPWPDAVRRWAWSYRNVFADHTPLIPVVALLPVAGAPETLKMYETVAEAFKTAGVPQERIVPAIVSLESFIFGSALDVTAPEDIFSTGDLAEASPVFTAAVQEQDRSTGEPSADVAFRFGLEALLAGLEAIRNV